MASPSRIDRIRARGISFLAAAQGTDGSFANFSAPDPDRLEAGRTHTTTFIPSLILCGLNRLPDDPALDGVRDALSAFLLAERHPGWSWNYWAASSPEYATLAYPDDLDDSFVALAALHGHQPDDVGGAGVAAALSLLTACEVRPGGPYRSWLVKTGAESVWQDIDPAVNANVAYFLSLHGVHLPGIAGLHEPLIQEGRLDSPYYHQWQPLAYFIARYYGGPLKGDLASWTLERSREGSLAQRAMALSALCLLGSEANLEPLAEALIDGIETDGWTADAVVRDPYIEGALHYAGCPALTCALCLEALHLYQERTALPQSKPVPSADEALRILKEEAGSLPERLGRAHMDLIEKVVQTPNGRQLLALPHRLSTALKKNRPPQSFLTDLALVIAYGWMAYTVYDDFLDDDGRPALLPVANVMLRRLSRLLDALTPEDSGFPALARDYLDRMEAANHWEVTTARAIPKKRVPLTLALPDYGDLTPLANRSLGHGLAGIALLARAGYGTATPESRALQAFFKHYLIARQLNDDAHDWKEDLERGHLTYAVTQVLADHAATTKRRGAGLQDLETTYWTHTITGLCQELLGHTQRARENLAALEPVMDTTTLANLLLPYEKAGLAALETHRQTRDLIAAYRA